MFVVEDSISSLYPSPLFRADMESAPTNDFMGCGVLRQFYSLRHRPVLPSGDTSLKREAYSGRSDPKAKLDLFVDL